jgi:hypothetical protein
MNMEAFKTLLNKSLYFGSPGYPEEIKILYMQPNPEKGIYVEYKQMRDAKEYFVYIPEYQLRQLLDKPRVSFNNQNRGINVLSKTRESFNA